MIDLRKELIDYLYDFNVCSDLTIEELAEDINTMYKEAFGNCSNCEADIATDNNDHKE